MKSSLTILAIALTLSTAWTQAAVTASDLMRLETTAGEIDARLNMIRTADPTLAAEATKTLSDLRDDITYLKVKLRREGVVTRTDYADVRDRLETLRLRAGGQKVSAMPVTQPDPTAAAVTVPVGAEFEGRLQMPLTSATAKIEQRFEILTLADVKVGDVVAIPAGTIARGFVSSVRAAGKVDRRGSLTLSFDEILIGTTPTRLRASVTQALDGARDPDMTRIGAGAAAGAVVGGVIAGAKGALLGVLIGGGGTIASTDGEDVVLPVGTVLHVRVDQPFDVVR